MLDKLRVLLQISVRNLFASKINWVIGGIICLGTMLVLVGGALLDSVDRSMSQSIRGSVAGDIQVYSAKSKDELAIFGAMGGEPNLTPVSDFDRMAQVVSKLPSVKSVVPMGISGALVTGGNTIDLTLAELREAVKAKDAVRQQALTAHVQQILRVLSQDLQRLDDMLRKTPEHVENAQHIARAASAEFWAEFDREPYSALEFLENRVAPQVTDAGFLYLRYMGTDFDAFQKSFDRLRIVDGTAVPPGRRGFLFNKRTYEDQVKLKTAHRLDRIKEARDSGTLIAGDDLLQRYVKENKTQLRPILLQLDAQKTERVVAALRQGLGAETQDIRALLEQLFDTTDESFEQRYRLFYDSVAPLLQLYSVRVGDMLTIKAFSRSGFVQSVNVKIYGTFEFRGLEKASLSGAMNLIDLMSFRDLYGYLTADKLEEIAAIKRESGAKSVSREDAEAALFGGDAGATVVAESTPGLIDESKHLGGATRELRRQDLVARVYTPEELRRGLVLNAAILLHDPDRVDEGLREVQAAADAAGLELRVVSWQKAAGLIGQFVLVAKLALYFAVMIIFIVLLVIINNAVMMATMQRVREIGTMRAIGSQRGFVLVMILLETLVLGAVFGGVGVGLGTGIIGGLHAVGIPAGSEELYFFFSGPRLFPTLSPGNIIAAISIVLVVSAISTLYPAFLAARVSPLRAMQAEE